MLKTIGSLNEPASSKNDGSRSASNRNNGSRLASGKNDGNGEVDGFGDDGVEYARKSGKLKKSSKSGNLKSEKMSKSWKLAKPKKNLLKSRNSPNFDAKDNGLSFLIPKARSAFNYLRLAFIKASILRYFDPKYHIWIETNVLSYAISGVLNQLASETSPNGVITKTDLG